MKKILSIGYVIGLLLILIALYIPYIFAIITGNLIPDVAVIARKEISKEIAKLITKRGQNKKKLSVLKSINSKVVVPSFFFIGYDYYDHSGGKYVKSMINVNIDEAENFIYNFDLSIEENIKAMPRLKKISDFIHKITKSDLLTIIKNEPQLITRAKSIPDHNTFAVSRLFRGREDTQDEKESSTLNIVIVRSDNRTIFLIDSLYNLLKEQHNEKMTSVFKKIQVDSNKLNDTITINDLLLFATKLEINGYVICPVEQEYNVLTSSIKEYSYSFEIPSNMDKGSIDGEDLTTLTNNFIGNKTDIIQTNFTDVCICYNIGMHIEILSYILVSKMTDNTNDSIPNNTERLQEFIRKSYKNNNVYYTDGDAHRIHYLKNIYRRLDRELYN